MMAIVEYVKAGYTYPGVLKTKTALRPPKTPKLENKDPPPLRHFFNIFFYGWRRGGLSRTIIGKV